MIEESLLELDIGLSDGDMVRIGSVEEIAALAGAEVNAILTIVATREPDERGLTYRVARFDSGAHGRIQRIKMTLDQVAAIRAVAIREAVALPQREHVVIQAEDIPVEAVSVSWEARVDWQHVRLIPDLYYLMARGYEGFAPPHVAWADREPRIVWRGSSTGLLQQVASDLDILPRYRLCGLAATLGAHADVGITEVVQCASPQDADRITDRLTREGLLRPFLPMSEMTRYRYLMDIDGNSNSWNFMMKLRLGCCILRVESPWLQWFSDRLVAWDHYVPVARDLSDFVARVEWCLANPAECASIAERGRQFALDMRYDEEMIRAARIMFAEI